MLTYEVLIRGLTGTDEALEMQEQIKRVLCPVEEHDGPCMVPWGFSVSDGGDLVLGIYASAEKAAVVADRVRHVVGGREVALAEGTRGRFDELAEQWRIEHGG